MAVSPLIMVRFEIIKNGIPTTASSSCRIPYLSAHGHFYPSGVGDRPYLCFYSSAFYMELIWAHMAEPLDFYVPITGMSKKTKRNHSGIRISLTSLSLVSLKFNLYNSFTTISSGFTEQLIVT